MTRDKELARRHEMWKQLITAGGPQRVRAQDLRKLGMYGGAQGIWVDKDRTKQVQPDGVTVGLLHTGSAYPDDLSDDGVLYHYPVTGRQAGRDAAEIRATKSAGELGLPVFVITKPTVASGFRDVHLGWVEGWDDDAGMFLVTFGENQPDLVLGPESENAPFQLEDQSGERRTTTATSRPGQQRFKLRVMQYYGVGCAVCDIRLPELLDAAHIRPKRKRGSDDPRNGLLLCPTHHRAFDSGLFGIVPGALDLQFKPDGPTAIDLGMSRPDLHHLPRKPHESALTWAWEDGDWREVKDSNAVS